MSRESLLKQIQSLDEAPTPDTTTRDFLQLASFPEQNPNPVVETDEKGAVAYLNPAAAIRFPDLWQKGPEHPLLEGLEAIVAVLKRGGQQYLERELDMGESVFEERICYTRLPDGATVRVYAHDVTERRRAQQAIQELARRVVLAQEEERHRVSRELHDEAGQALAALKISLQLIQADLDDPQAVREGLGDAIALVESTREQIRLLAHGLHPPALDALGLLPALEDFCREFRRRTDLAIEFRGRPVPDPVDAVKICLYRFLQEALANVVTHAEASRVEVVLGSSSGVVWLRVQDDGRGIDPAALQETDGLGLVGMRERIELLNGTLHISSSPGAGTSLVATLPAVDP